MLTDLEIARAAEEKAQSIIELAEKLGLPTQELEPYGYNKAKVKPAALKESSNKGKLVLVTAVSPTPAGEGKTTTSVGLADAINARGTSAALSLREPSMGPVFGIKGGAAGGGYAQVIPMEDINLAFTGDFPAIAAANNLLAALIDNHLHQGNELRIDARQIWWRRVMDMNDRALRQITVGQGGPLNGFLREDGFDIVSASEIMAIVCLASDFSDLKERLGNIVIGLNLDKQPVTARELGAVGAMAVILKDVMKPNLVQTLEGNPAFVHGGPFANIAHGCSSLVATRAALSVADVAITEAGFGADLGAEKFFDILCRQGDLKPEVTVLVATIRSIKYQAGVPVKELNNPAPEKLAEGIVNINRHLENLKDVFGTRVVVALNRFPSDTDEEVATVQQLLDCPVVPATHFAEGSQGALELADAVLGLLAEPAPEVSFAYDLADDYQQKAKQVAQRVYHADSVSFAPSALRRLKQIEEAGYTGLPICVAKTQYSFSTDPKALGAPEGHELQIRQVRLSAGAGFVVLVAGDMMTMPGLSAKPAALGMDIDDEGVISGLS
ncbi:formate--tetrahydrofolate ligase [Boudabousia liubingyangii]|uniref:Formate--tetrahydrofolate ligase n=1 Tax=Boudabousia liubingyangii TaxID=1921764 RepID=A0A1Q5PKL3_9ACTO|nr:formate--tetrahydrofolate ligase [Boudabousia liubingyangii]OKL46494.1 formate--tetrahydrofolate ligase [Boudabousia liubingyangii]OKL47183.1 formate--tetrahydrofolate ligase [Boudabousia liubingyangii]